MHLTAGSQLTAKRWKSELRPALVISRGRTFFCLDASIFFGLSIFLSRVTIFLEWRRSKFHYSVIDGNAAPLSGGGFGFSHLSNHVVPFSDFAVVSFGSAARGGDI